MGFPSMNEALWGWDQALQFKVVTKTATDFEVVEAAVQTIWFRGVMEPIPMRELKLKPEGQRSWRWYTMYSAYALDADSIIEDTAGIRYRVMSTEDWSTAGYTKYELAQAPNV